MSTADCFVVLPPNCAEDTVIIGRNVSVGVSAEIHHSISLNFYEVTDVIDGQADGGAAPELGDERLRIILQKSKPGIWGGEYGGNERNICIGLTWSNGENGSDCLLATDVIRYTLATASTATQAVEIVGNLIASHGHDDIKFNLLICDSKEVWILSCGGKLWAAQQLKSGFARLPSDGLAVTTSIEKSSEALEDALKTLGFWNGETELDFAACLNATPTTPAWCGVEPSGDGSYTLTSMFETLRTSDSAANSAAANVAILTTTGITCHWFTATPNTNESVFKPFVFAPNPKISPLTKANADNEQTLLHELHAKRKPAAIVDLKQLEAACVEEVDAYLAEHPTVDAELDELLKDCVEAEVKFYR